jgi:hypothetical protein
VVILCVMRFNLRNVTFSSQTDRQTDRERERERKCVRVCVFRKKKFTDLKL